MKRIAAILCLALITALPAAADTSTVTLDAGLLTDSSGVPLADGDLILLLVSPSGVFTPTVGNTFVSGDNLIVSSTSSGTVSGAFAMNSSAMAGETFNTVGFDLGQGATGASTSSIVTTVPNTLPTTTATVVGDKLAIRWYSDYTLADFELGLPVTGDYGTYTTSLLNPDDDFGANWVVATGAVELNFNTTTDTAEDGDQNFLLGYAATPTGDISVVPEPSTYALFATGLLVVAGMARRKRLAMAVTVK
jgi:hypothetical protein